MRQRLSSEPDRYRGRRRVPTPPRSRYAVVGAAAFVGAGFVALGAGNLPDAKALDPSVIKNMDRAGLTAEDLANRGADSERASRGEERGATTKLSDEEAQAEAWLLPLDDFNFTSGYVQRAISQFPKQGTKAPWKLKQNYAYDVVAIRRGAIDDGSLEFASRPRARSGHEEPVAA